MVRRSGPGFVACFTLLIVGVSACASTVVPQRPDVTRRDVVIGVNPDGFDPFVPTDASDVEPDQPRPDTGWNLPDVGATDERSGIVRVGTYPTAGSLYSWATAEFRLRTREDDPRCRSIGVANISVSDFATDGMMPADMHPRPFPHAGQIRFVSTPVDIALNARNDGTYASWTSTTEVFPAGNRVTIMAQGGNVPSFRQEILIPSELMVRITSPGGATIDRERPFTVEWSPTSAESVWIYIEQTYMLDGAMRRVRVAAESYADEGRVTFAPSVLRSLPGGATPATLTCYPVVVAHQRVGNWPISFSSIGPGQTMTLRIQ